MIERSWWIRLGCVLAALAIAAGSAWAGGGEQRSKSAKPPSPARALQTAVKKLKAARSYRVAVDIQGGFATDATHDVKEVTVRESYEGEVYGTLMHVPAVRDAYRLHPKGRGAVYIGGTWRDILSDRLTLKLERLFKFPEDVLVAALKHARSAQWFEGPEPAADGADLLGGEEDAGKARAASDDGAQETPPPSKGRTEPVRKGAAEGKTASASAPRWLRVETSQEEALTHLVEVQNSNCFGGG